MRLNRIPLTIFVLLVALVNSSFAWNKPYEVPNNAGLQKNLPSSAELEPSVIRNERGLNRRDSARRVAPGQTPDSPGRNRAERINEVDSCPNVYSNPDGSTKYKIGGAPTHNGTDLSCCGCNPDHRYVGPCRPDEPSTTQCEPCARGTYLDGFAHFQTSCKVREGVGTDEGGNFEQTTIGHPEATSISAVPSSVPQEPREKSRPAPTDPLTPTEVMNGQPWQHTVAIAIGGVFAVGLVMIIIWFCCWKRPCRKQNPDPENGGEAMAPNPNLSNRQDPAPLQNPGYAPVPQDDRRNDDAAARKEASKKGKGHCVKYYSGMKRLFISSRRSSSNDTIQGGRTPTTENNHLEKAKIDCVYNYLTTENLPFNDNDLHHFCHSKRLPAPHSSPTENSSQQLAKVIENNFNAGRISSMDVLNYFQDSKFRTIYFELLERFHQLDRSMNGNPQVVAVAV